MKTRERLKPRDRKMQMLDAAVLYAAEVGIGFVKRDELATRAGCSQGLIHAHFGTIGQLRRSIIRHAIKQKNLSVIAQGLAINDREALKAPDDLKSQARASLG